MKKIYTLLLLVFPFLLQSCLKEEKDIFGKDPSIRMEEALKNYKKVLAAAENGWSLEYYAEPNQKYGGYNFAMKFSTSEVSAYSELADNPSESVTSMYQLISDDGPVLSFDTYNMFLHFFSNPSEDYPDALEGDYEFILQGISEDQNEIKLKGKKTGNRMVLRRLSESPADYLAKVASMQEQLAAPAYSMTANGKVMDCSLLNHTLTYQYMDENEAIVIESVAFCYTPTGIELYEETEINGLSLKGFTFENGLLTASGGNAIISLIFPPLNETVIALLSSTATFAMDFSYAEDYYDMSETLKSWISTAYEANTDMGETLLALYFRFYKNQTCFQFISNDGKDNWAVMFGYTLKTVPGTEDEVIFGSEYTDGINAEFYPHLAPVVSNIIGEGTYKIEADNTVSPTAIKFTSKNNPSIWFILYSL